MVMLTDYRVAYTTEPSLIEQGEYPQRVHWFPETYHRTNTGLVYPPHKLADKVLDPELLKRLRENPAGKTAFILASGNAHFAGLQPMKGEGPFTYTYRPMPLTLTQVYAGRVAQSCGATDMITTDATACASSIKALMDVQTLMRMYRFRRVVVLAVEDAVSNTVLKFFGESGACLTHKTELETGRKPSAFDPKNGGFYVAQGAALAVFEDTDVGIARMEGAYTASEACSNPLGQLDDGTGFVKAMTGALDVAGLRADQIRMVKTHGTGTTSNNAAERAALQHLLRDGFIATSFKPTIGHTMGASGLLESLLMLERLQTGVVSAIENRTERDDVFLSEASPAVDRRFMSLAAGMGNVYAAAIWSKQ